MEKNDRIGHEGVVKGISAQTIEVTITSNSACSGCHAKSACGMSDIKQKDITADFPGFNASVGDKVMVYATVNNAIYSVIIAYIIPSFLLVSAIFFLTTIGIGEIYTAISSLILLTFYFILLYMCRKKIGRKIKFTIEKIN